MMPGILSAIAKEGLISIEAIGKWTREQEKILGYRIKPMDAVLKNLETIDEGGWIQAAYNATRTPYHPIGHPGWLQPEDHSEEALRHYEDNYGIVLANFGRLSHIGMLDCTPEACARFVAYFEAWRQYRFFCIGPHDFATAMRYLKSIKLSPTHITLEEPADEPIIPDEELLIPRILFGLNVIDIRELTNASTEDMIEEKFIPVRKTGSLLWIATTVEGWNEQKKRLLRSLLECEPKALFISQETFEKNIKPCIDVLKSGRRRKEIDAAEVREILDPTLVGTEELTEGNSEHIMRKLIATGIAEGASDIHIEDGLISTKIRMRIDGLPESFSPLDLKRGHDLIECIKTKTGLDPRSEMGTGTADASYTVAYENRRINLRLALLAQNLNGKKDEKLVIRILDPKNVKTNLDEITDLTDADRHTLRSAISADNGLILVTGPTGSGKSTTLFALIHELCNREAKRKGQDNIIYTVEDPIEYSIPGAKQVAVDSDAGLDYPDILRGFMRMDPDVILVQEIRDPETAKLALQASDTGHLVLSTLHTNDCVNTISRMVDGLGADRERLINTTRLITAQRLHPKRCDRCRYKDEKGRWRNRGCLHCHNRGRKGRQLVIETLDLNAYEDAKKLIFDRATEDTVRASLIASGWKSHTQQAHELYHAGIIEYEELM